MCLPLLIFPCTLKSRSSLLSPAHPGGPGKGAIKRLWYTGQPALAGTPVKNLRMLLEQSFTARMPLPMATSGFGLGRRCWSYPQWCYLHCLHTSFLHLWSTHIQRKALGSVVQVFVYGLDALPDTQPAGTNNTRGWMCFNSVSVMCCSTCINMFTGWVDFELMSGWPQTWKTWNTQGFVWTWKTHGILKEFCATSGKNYNK